MSIFDRIKGFFRRGSSEGVAMISCEDALRVVHEYLDGELVGTSAIEVQKHFEVCQRCYPQLHLETVFREAIRRAAKPVRAPEHLKARIVQLLAEAHSAD